MRKGGLYQETILSRLPATFSQNEVIAGAFYKNAPCGRAAGQSQPQGFLGTSAALRDTCRMVREGNLF